MATCTPASLADFAARSFERMPPVPSLPLPVAEIFHGRSQLAHGAHELRRFTAVGNVETIDVGEEEQPIGLHGGGEQRTEFVVVAEGAHQFADRDAVIFVDDGNDAQLHQFVQGILQILVAEGRGEVITRQQQLGYDFLSEEELLVGMHQQALADGGAGLHARHAGGPVVEAQVRHAGGDRARADDQVFVAREIELVDQRAHSFFVDPPAGRDQAGSDFDDEAHCSVNSLTSAGASHWLRVLCASDKLRICCKPILPSVFLHASKTTFATVPAIRRRCSRRCGLSAD